MTRRTNVALKTCIITQVRPQEEEEEEEEEEVRHNSATQTIAAGTLDAGWVVVKNYLNLKEDQNRLQQQMAGR